MQRANSPGEPHRGVRIRQAACLDIACRSSAEDHTAGKLTAPAGLAADLAPSSMSMSGRAALTAPMVTGHGEAGVVGAQREADGEVVMLSARRHQAGAAA
jgi:hypothetical protein